MTVTLTQNSLQKALFEAAKVGNTHLMREFITAGANPFQLDAEGHDAIFYANLQDPKNTAALLSELHDKEDT